MTIPTSLKRHITHIQKKKQNLTHAWMQEDKHEKLFYSHQSAIQDNDLHLFGFSLFAIFCRSK